MVEIESTSETRTAAAVQLTWQDNDKHVVVTPKDQDRFAVKVETAIEVLKANSQREQFKSKLNLLINQLSIWIKMHNHQIQRAYLTLRDDSLSFVVEKTVPQYDADFEDQLSALDLEIAGDSDLEGIHIHSIALPPVGDSSLESFLHPQFQIRFDR